jgi:MinD superfamily P-loop ATPase
MSNFNEITVLSGKGGTGKTSLSAAFATIDKNMVVADCDVDAANLHIILQPKNYVTERFITGIKAQIEYDRCKNCGLCINYCRFDAIKYIRGKVTIIETSCDGCALCVKICTSGVISMITSDKSNWYIGDYRNGKLVHARLQPGEENSGKLVNVVREQARQLAKENGVSTIIIDGPPGTGCPAISSVTGAKQSVLVTEPSKSGFHDLKRIVELLKNFKIKIFVVVNKFDLNIDMTCSICDWCYNQSIPVIGKIPFDPQFVEAMINCKSIIEFDPDSEISKTIHSIYEELTKKLGS